jgi:hypothetical protein
VSAEKTHRDESRRTADGKGMFGAVEPMGRMALLCLAIVSFPSLPKPWKGPLHDQIFTTKTLLDSVTENRILAHFWKIIFSFHEPQTTKPSLVNR